MRLPLRAHHLIWHQPKCLITRNYAGVKVPRPGEVLAIRETTLTAEKLSDNLPAHFPASGPAFQIRVFSSLRAYGENSQIHERSDNYNGPTLTGGDRGSSMLWLRFQRPSSPLMLAVTNKAGCFGDLMERCRRAIFSASSKLPNKRNVLGNLDCAPIPHELSYQRWMIKPSE